MNLKTLAMQHVTAIERQMNAMRQQAATLLAEADQFEQERAKWATALAEGTDNGQHDC